MSVIDFSSRKKAEPDVWQCRCGSYTFWLYSTGAAYCSSCREEAHSMQGYWCLPEKAQPQANQGDENIIPLR
jgi:hypothetical protein